MRRTFFVIFGLTFFLFTPSALAAELPNELFLKTDFKLWQPNPQRLDIQTDYQRMSFHGLPVALDKNDVFSFELPISTESVTGLDLMKIRRYLESEIAPDIQRKKEDVTISIGKDGKVQFDGKGLYGRALDLDKSSYLLKEALNEGLTYIELPLHRQDPVVTVADPELEEMGIKQLVSAGETDFSGSPYNRRNNIRVGLSKFNGHIVEPEETFVFGNVLGPVEPYTGYLPELVIKGDRTVPEYGGGLCQVSTTVYRAILSGGFPVTERRNHSYAVRYYSPIGLDATVYPPAVDLEFVNDTPAHLLMQSFTIGDKAYYNFYGTKDERNVDLIGPYYSNWTAPPPKRTEKSTKLKPGEVEVLGHAVPGITASWYRKVEYDDQEKEPYFEHIYSRYQARPDFVVVGTANADEVTDEGSVGISY